MELAEPRVLLAEVVEKSVCPESAREELSLNTSFVHLVTAGNTGSPKWMWFGKRHELRFEVG